MQVIQKNKQCLITKWYFFVLKLEMKLIKGHLFQFKANLILASNAILQENMKRQLLTATEQIYRCNIQISSWKKESQKRELYLFIFFLIIKWNALKTAFFTSSHITVHREAELCYTKNYILWELQINSFLKYLASF